MEREAGWYWVKVSGKWIIAEWSAEHVVWFTCGVEAMFDTYEFEEIGDNKIERNIKG